MIYPGCGVVVCFVFIPTRVCRNSQIYTLITSINRGKFLLSLEFFSVPLLFSFREANCETDSTLQILDVLKKSFSSLCISVWILSTYLTSNGHFIRWLDTAEERVSELDQDFKDIPLLCSPTHGFLHLGCCHPMPAKAEIPAEFALSSPAPLQVSTVESPTVPIRGSFPVPVSIEDDSSYGSLPNGLSLSEVQFI